MLRARAALVLAAAALVLSCKKERLQHDAPAPAPVAHLHFYGGHGPVTVSVDLKNHPIEAKSAFVVDVKPGWHHVLTDLGWAGDVVVSDGDDWAVPISPKQCFAVVDRSVQRIRVQDRESHPIKIPITLGAPSELGQLPCNATMTPRQTVRAVTNNAVFEDVIVEGRPFASLDKELGNEIERDDPTPRAAASGLPIIDRVAGTSHTAVVRGANELAVWTRDGRAAIWNERVMGESFGGPSDDESVKLGSLVKKALDTNGSSPEQQIFGLDSFGIVALGPEHTQAASSMFQGIARERQPGVYFTYRFGESLWVSDTTKRILRAHGVDLEALVAARDAVEQRAVDACLAKLPTTCGANVFQSGARLHALVHSHPSHTIYAQLNELGELRLSNVPPSAPPTNPWMPHTLVIDPTTGVNTLE